MKSNFERCCVLTDALIELGVENYFGPGPDSTFWRARQFAIGILQRELCELRYPPALTFRTSFRGARCPDDSASRRVA
jgi:hypothetical protein